MSSRPGRTGRFRCILAARFRAYFGVPRSAARLHAHDHLGNVAYVKPPRSLPGALRQLDREDSAVGPDSGTEPIETGPAAACVSDPRATAGTWGLERTAPIEDAIRAVFGRVSDPRKGRPRVLFRDQRPAQACLSRACLANLRAPAVCIWASLAADAEPRGGQVAQPRALEGQD